MSERMSEATKTVLLIIPLIAMSVFCGYRIGDKRGRAEMKRWQDDYYAHQKVDIQQEVLKAVSDCVEHSWVINKDGTPGAHGVLELFRGEVYCRLGELAPPAPATKPSKGKRKPLLCSGHDPVTGELAHEMLWTGECWAIVDRPVPLPERCNVQYGFTVCESGCSHFEGQPCPEAAPQPEVKPAPKCANGPIIYTIPCGPVPVLICDGGPNCPPVSVVQP